MARSTQVTLRLLTGYFGGEVYLPAQVYVPRLTPEIKLAAAVMAEALACLTYRPTAVSSEDEKEREHLSAVRWFSSPSEEPYTFRYLCQALRLDPDAVLEAIGVAQGRCARHVQIVNVLHAIKLATTNRTQILPVRRQR